MKVRFIEPPKALQVGGLEGAIRSLENALRGEGVEVSSGDAPPAVGEVFHFHGLWQPKQAALSARLWKNSQPFLVSPHGMLEPWALRHKWWKKWPYFWLIERRHLRRANCLLATATPEENRLRKMLPGTTVRTIPLGFTGVVEPDYEGARTRLGWKRSETVILFLSRLHEKKGLDLLLQALARTGVPAECRLVIVGGGDASYVRAMKALAQTLALPTVDWVGEIWGEDRWRYFQGADLFCLPSHSENFGLVVLEASQVGTPSLTTSTTPWGDWLSPDRGIVADPTIESIQQGLHRYFTTKEQYTQSRHSLAAWARSEFSWAALVPQYIELYRSLAEPRGTNQRQPTLRAPVPNRLNSLGRSARSF